MCPTQQGVGDQTVIDHLFKLSKIVRIIKLQKGSIVKYVMPPPPGAFWKIHPKAPQRPPSGWRGVPTNSVLGSKTVANGSSTSSVNSAQVKYSFRWSTTSSILVEGVQCIIRATVNPNPNPNTVGGDNFPLELKLDRRGLWIIARSRKQNKTKKSSFIHTYI